MERRDFIKFASVGFLPPLSGCYFIDRFISGPRYTSETDISPSTEPRIDDGFDYNTSQLGNHGWNVVKGRFGTLSSNLVADPRTDESKNKVITHKQTNPAGTFEVEAVNKSDWYGLRCVFISDNENLESARGYGVLWEQKRKGGIKLFRKDGDGGNQRTTLLEITDNHGGHPRNVRIERDQDTYTFTCYYRGEKAGEVTDDTHTTSEYWVQRHDAGLDQKVDYIRAENQ